MKRARKELNFFMLMFSFPEELNRSGRCGNCESGKGKVDITDEATLVFKTVKSLKGKYGATVVADILKGNHTKIVRERNLERIPTYGKLSSAKIKHLRTALHFLIADGYIKRDGGQYPVVQLTEKAEIVLEQKASVLGYPFGTEDIMAAAAVEKKAFLSGEENNLFQKLRELRLAIAGEEHVPPFVVFSDATLEDLVRRLPQSEEEMAEVHGIGAFKLKKYGERFLKAIRKFSGDAKSSKDMEPEDRLFGKLDRLRRVLAKKENVAATQIFSDTILRRLAEERPVTEKEFRAVKGIGPKKAEKYGNAFLKEINPVRIFNAAETQAEKQEEHIIPKNAKLVRGKKGKLAPAEEIKRQRQPAKSSDLETRAFLLYLEKVRTRLAKNASIPEEEICRAKEMETMAKTGILSADLQGTVKTEFAKAVATYKQICRTFDE